MLISERSLSEICDAFKAKDLFNEANNKKINNFVLTLNYIYQSYNFFLMLLTLYIVVNQQTNNNTLLLVYKID